MTINRDLKSIAEWLKANKISLNSGKMELVLFRSENKKTPKNMNFRISGRKINGAIALSYPLYCY